MVRVTPRYFISFVAIVNGAVSLISSSAHLLFAYSMAIDFFSVNFVCSHLVEGVYQLWEFPGRVFGGHLCILSYQDNAIVSFSGVCSSPLSYCF